MHSKESPNKILFQKVIFHHQYDSIYTLGSILVNMYKLPSVHKKCRQTSKFSSYLKGRHSNIKVTVEYPNYNHLSFLDCNVTISQDNLSTSIYIKTFTVPGTNYNSFINNNFKNNYVSTLNFLTNNGYPFAYLKTLSRNFDTLYFHRK